MHRLIHEIYLGNGQSFPLSDTGSNFCDTWFAQATFIGFFYEIMSRFFRFLPALLNTVIKPPSPAPPKHVMQQKKNPQLRIRQ